MQSWRQRFPTNVYYTEFPWRLVAVVFVFSCMFLLSENAWSSRRVNRNLDVQFFGLRHSFKHSLSLSSFFSINQSKNLLIENCRSSLFLLLILTQALFLSISGSALKTRGSLKQCCPLPFFPQLPFSSKSPFWATTLPPLLSLTNYHVHLLQPPHIFKKCELHTTRRHSLQSMRSNHALERRFKWTAPVQCFSAPTGPTGWATASQDNRQRVQSDQEQSGCRAQNTADLVVHL